MDFPQFVRHKEKPHNSVRQRGRFRKIEPKTKGSEKLIEPFHSLLLYFCLKKSGSEAIKDAYASFSTRIEEYY